MNKKKLNAIVTTILLLVVTGILMVGCSNTEEPLQTSLEPTESTLESATPEVTAQNTPATAEVTIKNTVSSKSRTLYTTGSVHVRTGAGKEYKSLGVLSKATKIQQIGVCDNGWVKIEYRGQEGYVSNKYVTENKLAKSSHKLVTTKGYVIGTYDKIMYLDELNEGVTPNQRKGIYRMKPYDFSNAVININDNSLIRTSLIVDVTYYVENGKYYATNISSDGIEVGFEYLHKSDGLLIMHGTFDSYKDGVISISIGDGLGHYFDCSDATDMPESYKKGDNVVVYYYLLKDNDGNVKAEKVEGMYKLPAD